MIVVLVECFPNRNEMFMIKAKSLKFHGISYFGHNTQNSLRDYIRVYGFSIY
jgi:hypothetical protein